MTMEALLPYLLPPLLGALIGYITNYVAIRMLFRPLRPWYLFGLRVPMTPGIIPAKRGELAARMGEMVGAHLLTPEDVVRTLDQEDFRRELRHAVADKLAMFLERHHGTLLSLVPPEFRHRFTELTDLLSDKLADLVIDYFNGDEFERHLQTFLQGQAESLLALDLEHVVTPEQFTAARNHIDALMTGYLGSDAVAESVGHFVDEKTTRWLRSEQPLRQLLPADLIDLLLRQIEKEIPDLLEKFSGLLHDPAFRKRMIASIRQGIEKFLDSLGGLAGLLSGFIDLDKVYAKIPDTLDQISEEIARWLREEKTREQVAALLRERIEGWLEKPLASYVEKLPYEKVDGVRVFMRQRAVSLVQSRKTADSVLGLAERGVETIRNRSFGSLLETALPAGGRESLFSTLEKRLLAMIRSAEVAATIRETIRRQGRTLTTEKALGRLASRLPTDVGQELEEILFQQISEVLRKEIPVLVDALNVRQMVEKKVNSLDLLEVEGLLLGVMQEQFRYINLFGALLGFLIGLLNLLILQAGLF